MIRIFITESTLLKRDFIPRWLSSDKGDRDCSPHYKGIRGNTGQRRIYSEQWFSSVEQIRQMFLYYILTCLRNPTSNISTILWKSIDVRIINYIVKVAFFFFQKNQKVSREIESMVTILPFFIQETFSDAFKISSQNNPFSLQQKPLIRCFELVRRTSLLFLSCDHPRFDYLLPCSTLYPSIYLSFSRRNSCRGWRRSNTWGGYEYVERK